MKKSLENKQIEPPTQSKEEEIEPRFRPSIGIASDFSDTEFLVNESKTVGKKSEETNEQYLNCTASRSNNCEFDGIKFQFDNSKFDLSDSETSINFGSLDEELFVGKVCRKDSDEDSLTFNHASECIDNRASASTEINEAKVCFYEVFAKPSKSSTYMEQSSSDLLLKKTTKITNFNFSEFDKCQLTDYTETMCAAEILMATNENKATLNRPKTNAHADETETAVDDSAKLPKLKNQLFQVQRSSDFSEIYERPGESYMESDENGPDQDCLRKRSDFYNARTVNFFLKKRCKTQRSKFTQKKVKFCDTNNPAMTEKIILDSEVSAEKDFEIKRYLFDFYFYIIYLIFITSIALSMVSSNMFYFTDVTVSLFFNTPNALPYNKSENDSSFSNVQHDNYSVSFRKTLKESNTFDDFWAFAESTMLDMLYWNFYESKMDPVAHTEKEDKKMLYENEILGVPRMRQVRVRDDSCEIHPNVKRFFQSCYYYYSVFSEETRPIKEGMENTSTATAWVYTKAKDLKTLYHWGEISIYGGGGYYLDFDIERNKTAEMIEELKKNHWVSRATRAVFIDFNLYNANVNLFLICKIVLEFPPVGGMLPREDFHALKLIRYLTLLDFFILGCEFVVLLFLIYFTYKRIDTLRRQKYSFFTYWWNYIDVLILLLLYTYIILGIVRYIYTEELIGHLQNNYFKYTEFAIVKELQITFNNIIAILVFLSWIKLFMYFNFNVRMLEFRKTLSRSLRDILGFFPMFLTMFIAFAVLAYLLFGNQVKDYDSVWSSFLALLQAFLGEFEYAQIEESNQILGPIFYITYIFFIFFVLLNVFIAIINDAYASVKSEVISDRPKTGEYVKRGFSNFFAWCNCRKKKKFRKKSSFKKKFIYDGIKEALVKAGFSEDEIKIFFAKYDINFSNIVDEKTRRKVIEDLELQRIDFTENLEQFEINTLRRQMDNLSTKIEEIEMSLQPVIDKVDILLTQR